MSRVNRITLDGDAFQARAGQRLLDAALEAGVDMPHDCRAGRCGSCLTRVLSGVTLGGETRQPGMVHACQAMVFSDLALEVEPLPPVCRIQAGIVHMAEVARDIVEVTMAPTERFESFPGQYCRFRFRGFPARPFSPTAPLVAVRGDGLLRLQIKRVRDGRVTPELGRAIGPGHPVQIEGPFGHAFLRPGGSGRLVMIGSGTGFAPIWSVAAAALAENPERRLVLVAASRKLDAFYMGPALSLASRYPNVTVIAAIEDLAEQRPGFVAGRPTDHLPELAPGDIVYAAGSPAMVSAIGDAAIAAGATFHSDPFEPAGRPEHSWLDSAREWLTAG